MARFRRRRILRPQGSCGGSDDAARSMPDVREHRSGDRVAAGVEGIPRRPRAGAVRRPCGIGRSGAAPGSERSGDRSGCGAAKRSSRLSAITPRAAAGTRGTGERRASSHVVDGILKGLCTRPPNSGRGPREAVPVTVWSDFLPSRIPGLDRLGASLGGGGLLLSGPVRSMEEEARFFNAR